MNPRRLEALRAMAAQTASPHEREIAAKALERHYAQHPEDRPEAGGVGRKTVPVFSDPTGFPRSTDPPMTYADLMAAMDDIARAFGTPRAAPGDVKHAPPCPLCRHKHARTGTWCSFCALAGIADDCNAYFGPDGWATFDGGPLA